MSHPSGNAALPPAATSSAFIDASLFSPTHAAAGAPAAAASSSHAMHDHEEAAVAHSKLRPALQRSALRSGATGSPSVVALPLPPPAGSSSSGRRSPRSTISSHPTAAACRPPPECKSAINPHPAAAPHSPTTRRPVYSVADSASTDTAIMHPLHAPTAAPAPPPPSSEGARLEQLEADERLARRMQYGSSGDEAMEESAGLAATSSMKRKTRPAGDEDDDAYEDDSGGSRRSATKRPKASATVSLKATAFSRSRQAQTEARSPQRTDSHPRVVAHVLDGTREQLDVTADIEMVPARSPARSASSSHAAAAISAPLAPHVPVRDKFAIAAAEVAQLQSKLKHTTEKQRADYEAARHKGSALPVSLQQMAEFYQLHEGDCGATGRKSCGGQPNCLHGIIAPKSKTGIWAASPPQLKTLGPDPASRQRAGAIAHAGLKNLGATCYMNTLFQCLFMNAHFRYSIYQFRSAQQRAANGVTTDDEMSSQSDSTNGAAQDRIVLELQNLFARLEFGRASYEDPRRIVESLGLKPGEQQDVNEFNNLFLQVLESRLKLTGTPGLATLVDDEFKGTIVHTIRCMRCQTRRENRTTFYDLTVQIKGLKTVRECLTKHMQKEELTQGNRYKCGTCGGPQDAERSTVLEHLPPVLNLQLLRFGYDPATGTKRKLQDNISIPAVLDLAPFTNEDAIDQLAQELAVQQLDPARNAKPSPATAASSSATLASRAADSISLVDNDLPILPLAVDEAAGHRSPSRHHAHAPIAAAAISAPPPSPHRYELTAILRHKGASAHHGHYIADIRDPDEPARWWRFDDDSCKPLTQFDDGASGAIILDGDSKDKKKKSKGSGGAAKKKRKMGDPDSGEEDDDEEEGDQWASAAAKKGSKKKISDEESEGEDDPDVTVLDSSPPPPAAHTKLDLSNISSRNAYMLVYTRARPCARPITREELTSSMEQQIQESDAKLTEQIATFKQKKELLLRLIQARKDKCTQFMQESELPIIRRWDLKGMREAVRRDESLFVDIAAIESDWPSVAARWLTRGLEDGYFVSGAWLKAWLAGVTPPVDARDFQVTRTDAIDCTDDEVGPDGKISDALQRQIAASEGGNSTRPEPAVAEQVDMTIDSPPAAAVAPSELAALDACASSVSPAAVSPAAAAGVVASAPAVAPTPVVLQHPLWPGDLSESLLLLLCEHGKPRPAHGDMKRISTEQWELVREDNRLQKAHLLKEHSPALAIGEVAAAHPLRTDDFCRECCQVIAEQKEQLQMDQADRDALYDDLLKFKAGHGPPGARMGFLMSKSYLKKWSDKAGREMAQNKFTQFSTEFNVNRTIECAHHILGLDEKDRYVVSPSIWESFVRFYPSSNRYPVGHPHCPTCLQQESIDDEKEGVWSERAEADKKSIKGMIDCAFPLLSRALALIPSFSVLLPGEWASAYRDHITGKLKVIPPRLRMSDLICDHGGLLFNPVPHDLPVELNPEPYNVRGSKPGQIAYCSRDFWNSLERDGKYFDHAFAGPKLVKLFVKRKPTDHLHDAQDWNQLEVTTDPAPCVACAEARLKADHDKEVEWAYSTLVVRVLLPGAVLPSSIAGPAAGAMARPRRAATRKTKGAPAELSHEFETELLSSKDPLSKVKLNIYQNTDVPPGQQQIYFNGRRLVDDSLSLAALEVPPSADLWVVRDLDGDGDTSALFGESYSRSRRAAPEAGFAGTALSSAPRAKPAAPAAASPAAASDRKEATKWTCATCTFLNEAAHLACEMCGSEKA